MRRYAILTILVSIFLAVPVYSQVDFEKGTRETDLLGREQEEIKEKLRKIPEKPAEVKPEEIPVAKEEEKFFVRKISLVGCESFSPEDFSSIVSKYENREVSLSDLNALAKEIEQEYIKRGVIAAVFVPQQEVREQTVILQVVEAKMGELNIQDHKYFRKGMLTYYWQVPSGEILRYHKLSRSVQAMNKNPDREVKAALMAGKKPGTTDVLLTPKTRFPVHLVSTFDREGSVATGRNRIGLGVRHNNLLSFDDVFLSGYTFGNDFSGTYAYHNLPISPYGTYLLYGYSRSLSDPKKEFTVYGLNSEAKNATISLRQDIYRKDEYFGEVFAGFDAKDKTTEWNEGILNRDRLRIVNLGANIIYRNLGNVTYFTPEFYQGVDAFGTSPRNNTLASRGASPIFSKFNLGIQHRRRLPLEMQANLKLKTQFSSTKLTPQEEYALGGIDSVRGYPSGDYLADNAVLTSAELLMPNFVIPKNWRLPYAEQSLSEQITPLVFLDYGYGMRRGSSNTEKKYANLFGAGAGLRMKIYNEAVVRMEWGFPLADNRTITESGNSRFHFSVDFQDKLPEELARIRKMREEESIRQMAWCLVDEELARPESPVRQKLYGCLQLAQEYYEQGRLEESAELYKEIARIGKLLYQQAEEYVRATLAKKESLVEYRRLAIKYQKEGKLVEAKEMWQKVIDEAKPEPLTLEF